MTNNSSKAASKADQSSSKRDILVTGFPSFVARKLLEAIIAREPDAFVRLLVRPDYIDAADRALTAMEAPRERIALLSGDVVAIDLGLSGREYLEVIANVTDIYNVASIWFLGVERNQAYEVNVTGARNIIDSAYEMQKLRRLNHFSTAFVAGDRTGVIMEDELAEEQGFRNVYEETKYLAELAMREAMAHLPISIYRPSIIVGDSSDGEIDKMAGPYYLMNAIVNMPSMVPILMPGKGDKPLNLVPIDFVCNAMYTISRNPQTAGKTFHLCDPNPLSARKVFELVAQRAGKRPPVGAFPYRLTKLIMKFPYLERLTRNPRQFMDDFNQLTIYNSMNTMEALDGHYCPPFPTYVDRLVDFIKVQEIEIDLPLGAEIMG
ncbi:MAG: SDR family oxidoreductase [Bradymonadaceae bacterium]|nr:SDR family oxidoreductase [Lujinxingiaceae bacterium]